MPDSARRPTPPLYYSDRHDLRGEPVADVGAKFWEGFLRIYGHLRNEGFLVREFGSACLTTGDMIDVGVDDSVEFHLRVEVGIEWGLESRKQPPQSHVALDCVEFFARRVAKPNGYHWHDVPGLLRSHRDYGVPANRDEGLREYAALVNALFRVHAHPFQLVDGQIARRGEPEFEAFVSRRAFQTGDVTLDSLVEQARTAFWSVNTVQRRIAIERSWDAFERMKTVLDPDKKRGIRKLLERATASPEHRALLEHECEELTEIGNRFQIRHHEVDKVPVTESEDFDYLFYRQFSLLTRLLPFAASRAT